MGDPAVIGKSGTRLTEVRSGRMTNEGKILPSGPPKNPYLDDSPRKRAGARRESRLFSGIGESKIHCREDLPKGLTDELAQALKVMDDHALLELTDQQVKDLTKLDAICWSDRAHGYVLSAEGRRIAAILVED